MNFEKKGKSYFRVYNSRTKSSRDVYISPDEAKKNIEVLAANENDKFILTPCKELERDVLYVTGRSGSGKSTFAGEFADEYHRIYPKRPIILFSLVTEDASIDRKYIKKIDLAKLVDAELSLEDFKKTLCIFDDVDADLLKNNKPLLAKMKSVQDQMLLMGRHHKISVILLAHEGTRGKDSKRILNECNVITIFPYHMKPQHLNYLTKEYFGLTLAQRREMMKTAKQSRSVSYIQSYPPAIFSSKLCYMIEPDIE